MAAKAGPLIPFVRPLIDLCASDHDGNRAKSQHARTICELVDHSATANPDHVFCLQQNKDAALSKKSNVVAITFRQFKIAIQRCMKILTSQIVEAHPPELQPDGSWTISAPVALLAESDVNLLIHEFALISLGIPVLLVSARLGPVAIRHLLSETGAVALLATPSTGLLGRESTGSKDGNSSPVQLYTMASRASLVEPALGRDDDWQRPLGVPGYDRGTQDCSVIILHSSGTTGLPKPIYHSHTFLQSFGNCHLLYDEAEAQATNVSTLPLYHGFGLVAPGLALGVGKTVCLPLPGVPATGDSIVSLIRQVQAGSLMSVPSILEELSLLLHDGETAKLLASLHFVAFGGGLLKPTVGDDMTSAGVKLLNHYGTTESGPLAPMFAPKEADQYDWRYFRLRTDIPLKITKVVQDCPLERPKFKLTTYPYGWNREFEIQDQLITNPNNSERDFSAVGRKDAFIALASGEKVDPSFMENSLTTLPEVKFALAFGTGRFELGILVQPMLALSAPEQIEAFKLSIWEKVATLNDKMDSHAKITSPHALLYVPNDVSIPRTDKGSIMRLEAYNVFDKQIAEVYDNLDRRSLSRQNAFPLNLDTLERDLKDMIQTKLPNWRACPDSWRADTDFFDLGMDSLQVLHLQRILRASIKFCEQGQSLLPESQVTARLIYQNSSIASLAQALRGSEGNTTETMSRKEKLDNLLSQFLPLVAPDKYQKTVLLTGGTGSLGVHILAQLLADPSVEKVVCLNRPSSLKARQQTPISRQMESAASKSVHITAAQWEKCEVIEAKSSASSLGLDAPEYLSLCSQVTHIIHNAWPMDFQQRTESFNAQFHTVKNLLAFASQTGAASKTMRPTRFLLVSSIAVVGQYSLVTGEPVVPEQAVNDEEYTNDMGYAEAKLICERLVENALRGPSGALLEAAIIRVGQMSGSSEAGYWNQAEHIPALLQMSEQVGALPDLHGTFSWIPVDKAAATFRDICLSDGELSNYYHLENPVRQPWDSTMKFFSAQMGSLPILPFGEWLDRVKAFTSDDGIEAGLASHLVQFFEHDFEHMANGGVTLDTTNTRKTSETLREMGSVSHDTLQRSISYWRRIGLLKS